MRFGIFTSMDIVDLIAKMDERLTKMDERETAAAARHEALLAKMDTTLATMDERLAKQDQILAHLVTLTAVCSDRERVGTVIPYVDEVARSIRVIDDLTLGDSPEVLRIEPRA